MKEIVDFWVHWKQLAKLKMLRLGNEGKLTGNVRWEKWRKVSKSSIYTALFWGRIIKQNPKIEWKEESDLKMLAKRNETDLLNEEIRSLIQCQIWLNSINLDANLQWISWSKTYWFDCLMEWMLEDSTWPNCRIILTKSSIHLNREWKKFIEALIKGFEKAKTPIWEVHKEDSKVFWSEWHWYVWAIWIVKIHNNHSLLMNEEISKKLNNLAESQFSNN